MDTLKEMTFIVVAVIAAGWILSIDNWTVG